MSDSPETVVQRQLDAYNARDIEAFMAVFADDAEGFELGAASPTLSGAPAIRERYTRLFAASPHLHSALVGRIVHARAVIDHERIAGWNGNEDVLEIVAIYEVVDGRILRFHFVR